jgi:DNA-binding NarL/FixJ family response regulator
MIQIAKGKGLKEIGNLLSLSEKTISTYRTRILEKMNMQTNAEIVKYALQNKLIE